MSERDAATPKRTELRTTNLLLVVVVALLLLNLLAYGGSISARVGRSYAGDEEPVFSIDSEAIRQNTREIADNTASLVDTSEQMLEQLQSIAYDTATVVGTAGEILSHLTDTSAQTSANAEATAQTVETLAQKAEALEKTSQEILALLQQFGKTSEETPGERVFRVRTTGQTPLLPPNIVYAPGAARADEKEKPAARSGEGEDEKQHE